MPAKIPLDTSCFYAFLERLQCSYYVAVFDGRHSYRESSLLDLGLDEVISELLDIAGTEQANPATAPPVVSVKYRPKRTLRLRFRQHALQLVVLARHKKTCLLQRVQRRRGRLIVSCHRILPLFFWSKV